MKKILFILLGCIFLESGAQNFTSSENFIYSKTYLSKDGSKVSENVTYFDGLGRAKQNIAIKTTPSGKDLVTPILYDELGREALEVLPFPISSQNGGYHGALDKTSADAFYGDKAYAEKVFENSPLQRVVEQKQTGNKWEGHSVEYAYSLNSANEVVKYSSVTGISFVGDNIPRRDLVKSGYYARATLYKNTITDENGNKTIEFINSQEQVIMIRRQLGTQSVDTYYVYNDYDQLDFVITPLAEEAFKNLSSFTKSDTDPIIANLCFTYRYDGRRRKVEQRLPGKDWEYNVYDKQDRLVLSQNGVLRAKGEWHFNKYDALGRVIYTGITSGGSRNSVQTTVNNKGDNSEEHSSSGFTRNNLKVYYTNTHAYPTNIKELLRVHYYDTYPSDTDTRPTSIHSQITLPNNSYPNRSLQGLPVANYVKNIEEDKWTKTWNWYDEKGRVIGTRSNNHHGGYTLVYHKLDFDGTILHTSTSHKRTSNVAEIKIEEAFTYDTKQRLLKHTHKINNNAPITLQENTYDELGRLKSKEVGGNLQTVDYRYNIKGWLTDINSVTHLGSLNDPQDLFAFRISYESPSSSNPQVRPMYNGNVSATTWRTSSDDIQRKYEYEYDDLDRLLGAYFRIPNSAVQGSYDEYLSYDSNGNILSLERYGEKEDASIRMLIDDLLYEYDVGNKLLNVTDAESHPSGFNDGNKHTHTQKNDFEYDADGNLIKDRNKGVRIVSYNHHNQPQEIMVSKDTLSGSIVYLYDANGNKLQQQIVENQQLQSIDYLDGFQYRDGKLDFIPTTEGYVKAVHTGNTTEYHYVYHYTDHLGNIRLSYGRDPETNEVAILKESHYYPFGLQHQGYVDTHQIFPGIIEGGKVELFPVRNYLDDSYRYTFGGKEEQLELGLNWLDFHARNYMPDLGRWLNPDPLAEEYPSWSSYNYVLNNPINMIDPDGMAPADWYRNLKTQKIVWRDGSKNYRGYQHLGYYYNEYDLDRNHTFYDGGNQTKSINGVVVSDYSNNKRMFGINMWGFSDGDQIKGHKGSTQGSFSVGDLPMSGPGDPKSKNKFAELFRWMLDGFNLIDNIPETNKTEGISPEVSNSVNEINNEDYNFYVELHYSEKETNIRRGSRRYISNLTSHEQAQQDSMKLMNGLTPSRLNNLLKIDSVGIREKH